MGKRLNTEIFIERSKEIHNNKYDYSFVEYKNNKSKVKIMCKKHGLFEQRPDGHLKGCGCNKCDIDNRTEKLDNFIKKASIIHNNKYDYSLVDYKNAKTTIKIICKEHGIFEQLPTTHTHLKHGCLRCAGLNMKNSDFIKKANYIHKDRYDYSLVEYKRHNSKVRIICKEHGIFEQVVNNHLRGSGCPVCSISKGELMIKNYLDSKNIKYLQQHTFDDCKNKNKLIFDFFIPSENICIEYDGIQHYEPVKFFGGIENLRYIQKNDRIKNKYCEVNGIILIRVKYNQKNIKFL